MQQGLANATLLAAPVFLAASNPVDSLSPLEVCGWIVWVAAWLFENAADVQKLLYMVDCSARVKAISADPTMSAALKESETSKIRQSCLGMPPFDGTKYWCWTLCR